MFMSHCRCLCLLNVRCPIYPLQKGQNIRYPYNIKNHDINNVVEVNNNLYLNPFKIYQSVPITEISFQNCNVYYLHSSYNVYFFKTGSIRPVFPVQAYTLHRQSCIVPQYNLSENYGFSSDYLVLRMILFFMQAAYSSHKKSVLTY